MAGCCLVSSVSHLFTIQQTSHSCTACYRVSVYSKSTRPTSRLMQGEIIMTSYTKYKTTKGSFWRFQIFVGRDETGKRIVKQRRGFATKKEAQLAAIKLKTELQNNSFVGNETITFNKVYELWFENYKLTTKESTWSTTERNFENHILPIFGSYPICKITPLQCQKAVNNWFSKPLRNYKRFLNDIARVFDYAVHLKIVKDNPTTAVIRPRPSQQTGKRKDEKDFYYTKNELNTFLECLYDMDDFQAYAFFRTLSFTGNAQRRIACSNMARY